MQVVVQTSVKTSHPPSQRTHWKGGHAAECKRLAREAAARVQDSAKTDANGSMDEPD